MEGVDVTTRDRYVIRLRRNHGVRWAADSEGGLLLSATVAGWWNLERMIELALLTETVGDFMDENGLDGRALLDALKKP